MDRFSITPTALLLLSAKKCQVQICKYYLKIINILRSVYFPEEPG